MTESEHKAIVEFTATLAEMRQKVSDIPLLDKCQQYLGELLELSKDASLEPDPEPAQPPAQ